MIDFKEIYNSLTSLDNSTYAGLTVISTAALATGFLFYIYKKDFKKNSKDDEKSNLEKEVKK